MAAYSKKTCHKCGIRLPQPDMIAKTIQVETGNSRKTLSTSEFIFAALGNKKARRAVGRTFTSPNKRRYVRNKDVWECYKCAGVETPEEKRQRLENESRVKEQLRIAKEREYEERKRRVENELASKNAIISQRVLAREMARDKRATEGSFARFLLAFAPQFLFSFALIYLPLSEIYLRRVLPGFVKFVGFYVLVILTVLVSDGKNVGLVLSVPLVMGLVDLLSGILFFRKKVQVQNVQIQSAHSSSSPSLPPPLPNKESGDGIFIADKQQKQNMNTEQLETLFQDAEEHLMVKSVLVGIGPQSMVGVILSPEAYDDGIKCLITIECTEDEELDDDKMELISDTVSDHLRQNWDLNTKLAEIGIDPDSLNWWPVCTQGA